MATPYAKCISHLIFELIKVSLYGSIGKTAIRREVVDCNSSETLVQIQFESQVRCSNISSFYVEAIRTILKGIIEKRLDRSLRWVWTI